MKYNGIRNMYCEDPHTKKGDIKIISVIVENAPTLNKCIEQILNVRLHDIHKYHDKESPFINTNFTISYEIAICDNDESKKVIINDKYFTHDYDPDEYVKLRTKEHFTVKEIREDFQNNIKKLI
jgi:hypothetical protein